MRLTALVLGCTLLAGQASTAGAADYAYHRHTRYWHHHAARAYIGECRRTRVSVIGAPAGSSTPVIRYADGVMQAFDSDMQGHIETRPGDPIQLCLVRFTRDCGEDDLPGRTYATGNLRTGAAWTLPDVRSSCQAR